MAEDGTPVGASFAEFGALMGTQQRIAEAIEEGRDIPQIFAARLHDQVAKLVACGGIRLTADRR